MNDAVRCSKGVHEWLDECRRRRDVFAAIDGTASSSADIVATATSFEVAGGCVYSHATNLAGYDPAGVMLRLKHQC
jgi:hypothetical protein